MAAENSDSADMERAESDMLLGTSPGNKEKQANSSSKRYMSANYLLNFNHTLPEQGRSQQRNRSRKDVKGTKPRKVPRFSKAAFLQSNCQLVVDRKRLEELGGQVSLDMVNWNAVLEVRLRTERLPDCPICLYPPVAARATHCGHVYCWPCIIRYYDSKPEVPACPLCHEEMFASEMKVASCRRPPDVKDCFVLVKRRKDSVIVRQAHKMIPARLLDSIPRDDEEDTHLSHLVFASGDYNLRLKSQAIELIESKAELTREGFLEDIPAVVSALLLIDKEYAARKGISYAKLKERALENLCDKGVEAAIQGEWWCSETLESCYMEERLEREISEQYLMDFPTLKIEEQPFSEANSSFEAIGRVTHEQGEASEELALSFKPDHGLGAVESSTVRDYYFYYQDMTGRNRFLHPVIMKVLGVNFEAYWRLPPVLEAADIRFEETFVVDSELKSKYAILRHLLDGTSVQFVDINLRNLVTKATMQSCREMLEKRNKYIQREKALARKNAKNAEKRRVAFEAASKRDSGFEPIEEFDLNQAVEEMPALPSQAVSPGPPVSPSSPVQSALPSFSEMVAKGFTAGADPALGASSPPLSRSIWGQSAYVRSAVSFADSRRKVQPSAPADDELPAPARASSLGDWFQAKPMKIKGKKKKR